MKKNSFFLSKNICEFFAFDKFSLPRAELNDVLYQRCGVKNFFQNESEISDLAESLKEITEDDSLLREREKEFGDFQTNLILAGKVCRFLKAKGSAPEILVEPTCGRGNLVLSALETFPSLRRVVCVEIQSHYVKALKFSILDFYLERASITERPEIDIFCADVFKFDFSSLRLGGGEVLVLGNPPWVTNAALGAIRSENLPRKTNYKKTSGLDAITGKANFDLGEFILKTMLENFSSRRGHIGFLLKNSVIKNTVQAQQTLHFNLGEMQEMKINAEAEFDAAVDASLFFAKFANERVGFTCESGDFYSGKIDRKFGWIGKKFVADVVSYEKYKRFDGISPFVWRQGIKHDCAKILELECRGEDKFSNASGEIVDLEPDAVFGLLKSSDLKLLQIRNPRKYSVLTQTKTSETPERYLSRFPKLFRYLEAHAEAFAARKSSIYRNRPPYSMFGVGDYTLAPYKVAISGFYKQTRFSLVHPHKGKPMLLDDTCYFLGFNRLEDAEFVLDLLNSGETQSFLQSIVFFDAKRSITKDILMRIDLRQIAEITNRTAPKGFDFNFRDGENLRTQELKLIF